MDMKTAAVIAAAVGFITIGIVVAVCQLLRPDTVPGAVEDEGGGARPDNTLPPEGDKGEMTQ